MVTVLIHHRAWVLVGTALRLALASGFHVYSQSLHTNPHRQQVVVQTWWSLHNLECLLSTIIGRPSMIQDYQVTTPLPSDVARNWVSHESHYTMRMHYPDAQVRIAMITQEVLSKLYTKRRAARSWAQMHAIITSMMSELDEWATEAVQQEDEELQSTSKHELRRSMLRKQYYRTKILITRPSLHRIERCTEAGTEDFDLFDQEAAEACITTAHEVASLLPKDMNPKAIYENGPWWTLTHNSNYALPM